MPKMSSKGWATWLFPQAAALCATVYDSDVSGLDTYEEAASYAANVPDFKNSDANKELYELLIKHEKGIMDIYKTKQQDDKLRRW